MFRRIRRRLGPGQVKDSPFTEIGRAQFNGLLLRRRINAQRGPQQRGQEAGPDEMEKEAHHLAGRGPNDQRGTWLVAIFFLPVVATSPTWR
jgi:hypothetical protein